MGTTYTTWRNNSETINQKQQKNSRLLAKKNTIGKKMSKKPLG